MQEQVVPSARPRAHEGPFPEADGHLVAMFHTGRCGSTVLADMLNQHTRVSWAGEIFEKYMNGREAPEGHGFVERTLARCRGSNSAIIHGFETKYLPQQHLSSKCINLSLDRYICLLTTLQVRKFLVLHRNNYLRRVISAHVAFATKKYHLRQEPASPRRVTIHTDSIPTGVGRDPILGLFRCIDESYQRLKELLIDHDTLFLTYEKDILADPKIAYRKACVLLGVADESPAINFRRINPFAYEELVGNWDEVRAALVDTEYGWMLDD